jgi:hypothetical protein
MLEPNGRHSRKTEQLGGLDAPVARDDAIRALPDEGGSDCGADAASRAGHKSRLALQSHVGHHVSGGTLTKGITWLFDGKTLHSQERELVPVSALEDDLSIANSKDTAATQPEWIAPL